MVVTDGPTSDDLATEKKRNKVDSEKRKTAEADITSKEVVSKADNENKSDGTGSGSYENEDNEVGVAATSPIETYDKKGQNVSSITTTTTELTSSKVSAKDDKEANTLQAAVTSSLLAIEKNNQKDKIQEEIVAPIVVERNEVQKIILKSSRSRSATESDKWGASATLEIISTHSEVEDTAADKVVTSSSKTPLVQVSKTETDNKKNVLSPSTPVIDTVTENSKEQNGQKEDSDAALSKSLLDGVADAHKKYSVEGPEDSLEQKPTISCETRNDLTTVNDNVLLHLKTEQVPVKTLSARQTDERDDAAPVNYLSVDLRSVDLTAEDKRATADNSGACIERQKQNADPASYGVQKKFTSEDVLEQAHTDELCGVTAKREELLPTETLAHKSELLTGKSAEEFIRQTIKLQSACKTTSPSGEMDDKSKTETTESGTQSTSSTAIEDSKQQKTEQSARSNAEQETAAAPATPNNLKIVKKLADDGDTANRLAEEKKVELSFNEAVAEKENVTDGKQTSKDEKTDLISVEQISSVQAIKEASHLIESENVGAAVLITESTEPATVKVFEPKSESVKDNTEPEGGNTKKKSEPEEKSLKEKTSVVTENENQKPAAHTLGGSPKFAEAVKDEAAVDEGIVENGAEDDGEHSSDFTDEEVEPPETESQKSVAASGDAGSNNRKAEPDGNHDEAHDDEDVGEDLDFDEDKRNPQYIPKKGAFYEHDDRRGTDDESDEDTTGGARGEDGLKAGDGTESGAGGAGGIGGRGDSPELCGRGGRAPKVLQSETRDRWEHDLYDASEQGPKSVDELIAQYGYDIRDESAAPRAARRRKYGRGPNKYSRDWQDEKAYHSRATHGGQERHERHTGREGGRGDNNKEYHPRKDDFPCLNTASQQQQQQQPQQHASKDKDHERENRDHGGASRSERGDTRDNRREKDAPRRSDGGNKHEVQRRELPKKDLRHKLDNNRNNDRFDSRGDNRRDNRGGQRDIFGDSHNGHSRGGGDSYRDNYRDSNNYRDSRDNYSRDNNRTGGGDGHGYRDSRDGGYRDRADRDRERDRDGGNTRDQRADSSYRGNNNRSDNNGRDSGYNQSRSDNNHRENWREGRDSYRENFHRDHAGGDTGHRENFQKDGSSRGGSDVRDIRGGNRSDPGRKIGSGRTQDPRAIRKGQQQHQQQTQLQQQPHQMHQQQQHEPTTNNNNNNNINNISGGSTGHQGKTGDAALDRKIVDEKRQHQQHIQQQNATNVSENKRYTAQRAATRAEYGANQVPASQSQPLPPQPQHHAPATHQPMASTHPHSNHNPPPPPHAGQQHPAYYEVAPPHGHPPPGASYFVSQAFDSGAVPTGAPPQGFAPAPFMGPPPPFITSQTHAAPFMMGGPVAPDGSVHHGPPHGHHHPKAQLIPPNGGITYFSPQQQMYISHQQKPPQPRPKAIIPIVPPPDAANHKNSNASAVASGGNPAGNSSGGGQGGPEPGAAAPAQVEA
ncbi:uncharacterized protein LOC111262339 isoform X2 [Varroa jacobsoni]|uniref:uncharacterized protein LOC111262339 isoform X2 n=1 Tax=Varroa jacobsoni TaxID=62625 RepID=UPI000BF4B4F3|nr:uncharacterized protein LOC111262339 isoform X2 [Varroa jacobsoni]